MFGLPDETILSKYVIKTHYVMKVIEFHPEDQTVDLIQQTFEFCNNSDSERTVINELGIEVSVGLLNPEILYGIPVKQERWGQFEIQCCPQPGDTGYIEIFTNDISTWIKSGELSVPSTDRHFAKESCVFVPFIPNKKNKVDDYPIDGTKLVIKSKNASITITDNGESSDVAISANTMTVTADQGVNITGDVNVDGTVTASIDVIGGGVSLKNHKHQFTYSAGPTAGAQGETIQPTPEQGE